MEASGPPPSCEPHVPPEPRFVHVRWGIVALLGAVAFVLYVDRINLMVAIPRIKGEYGFSEQARGNILSAFSFGYALGLIPGGWLADRWGAHRLLTVAGIAWAVLTGMVAWLPAAADASRVDPVTLLIGVRLLLGVCEACAFPAFNCVLAHWMRRGERALASGLIHAGAGCGGAVAPLLIAAIIAGSGWRQSFLVSGEITLAVSLVWWWLATDRPARHRWVSPQELQAIAAEREHTPAAPPDAAWYGRAVRLPSAWLLCASEVFYGLWGYVFTTWFYTYFVEVRRAGESFSALLSSGIYLAMAIGAPLGGLFCDRALRKLGNPWGRRAVPLTAITLSGICGMGAAAVPSNLVSGVLFALAAGLLYAAAAAFWSTLIDITRRGAGVLGGLMNCSGNLGGAVGTISLPVLLTWCGWQYTLQLSGLMAVISGLIWLGIDPTRQIDQAKTKDQGPRTKD